MNPLHLQPVSTGTVPLTDLVLVPSRLRCRSWSLEAASARIEEYAETMADAQGSATFPSLLAVELSVPAYHHEGQPGTPPHDLRKNSLILVGGYTRHEAACKALLVEFPCDVYRGTWSDCLALAWKENSGRRHGTPRDKRDLDDVLTQIHAFPEYASLSTRDVAGMAECSHTAVLLWRHRQTQSVITPPPPPQPPPSASPSPSSAPAARELRDAWGRVVPVCVAATFEPVPFALHIASIARDLGKQVAQLTHGPDGQSAVPAALLRLDLVLVLGLAEKFAGAIESVLPWLVCPWCDGWGCSADANHCGGAGTLTRDQAESLPPDVERKARSFALEQDKNGGAA